MSPASVPNSLTHSGAALDNPQQLAEVERVCKIVLQEQLKESWRQLIPCPLS